MSDTDEKFFKRADDHINLSNEQLASADVGEVSATMMFSSARFNAWVSACGFNNGTEMAASKDATIEYILKEYENMLRQHLDDYIKNFDYYMKG